MQMQPSHGMSCWNVLLIRPYQLVAEQVIARVVGNISAQRQKKDNTRLVAQNSRSPSTAAGIGDTWDMRTQRPIKDLRKAVFDACEQQ